MAKGSAVVDIVRTPSRYVVPVSPATNWHEVNSDAEVEQNSGDRITDPGAVTAAEVLVIDTLGHATTIAVACNHTVTGTSTQDPVVNVFGKDENGVYQVLPDAAGDIDVTLTIDNTNDVDADSKANHNKMSTAKEFDLLGNRYYEVHVKDAINWTTETGSIYAREY